MILYNCKKVFREGKTTDGIIAIINYITYRPYPKHLGDPIIRFAHKDWGGSNFLINPEGLLENRRYTKDRDIVQYIELSSLRNYGEYLIAGKKTLDLLAVSGKEDLFKNNNILYVSKGQIYFTYEEL
jgi:hypothetical protein